MFYIRADANEIIGTGHVMRCLSIAEEVRRQGEEVTFIIADERTEMIITEKGFQIICLSSVWNDLDKEIDKLLQVIAEYSISLLLIDSYYVTKEYLETLHRYIRIAYIDDLNQFIYPVDYLINYNIYAENLDYPNQYRKADFLETKFMLGCSYAPLRPEFSNVQRVIKNKVSKILITSGGTDNYNVVGNILESLSARTWFSEMDYYVILGRFNIHKSELEERWRNSKNVHLLSNVDNMVDYMKSCDIAVTAGGVTTYELCACGIPSVMYTLADNQLQIAQTVSEQDLIPWIGDVRQEMNTCMDKLVQELESIKDDVGKRKRISSEMKRLVDGEGCNRIVERLI